MKRSKLSVEQLREFRHGLSVKARYQLLSTAIVDRESSLELLGYDDYPAYLRSALWHRIRRKVYARANGKCEACGECKPENVHHWSYSVATLMGRKLKNLEAVCKRCHDQFHEEPGISKGERQLTPQRAANQAWRTLVRSGGILAQPPKDLRPRLVKARSA